MKRHGGIRSGSQPGEVSVIHIVTSSLSVSFYDGQPSYFRERGFRMTVVSAPGKELDAIAQKEGADVVALPMERGISLTKDFVSLWRLWVLLRRLRPAIVDCGTPKAGLLANVAGWLSGVPCRIYTLYGLRLETVRPPLRWLLLLLEWVACSCAHRVICISPSLRDRIIELHLVSPSRTKIVAQGSVNGIDVSRFQASESLLRDAQEKRRQLGIPLDAPVLGFVGRLAREKGIVELLDAYRKLRPDFPGLRLMLLGEPDPEDALPAEARRLLEEDNGITCTGHVPDPAPYYHIMDIMILPSYREGFGTVLLEAAAAGRPTVASRVTGVVDAVADGKTGLLVPPRDALALADAIRSLLESPQKRERMGRAGWERSQQFSKDRYWQCLEEFYREMLVNNRVSDQSVLSGGKAGGI